MEFKDFNILELQKLRETNELTYHELTKYYLNRIESFGDLTNSISCINPNALSEAIKLDEEFQNNGLRSLMHGIPVLLKDNINTLDMKTTAGAVVFKDFYSEDDAFIVKKLKEAGAVILGKTNLSELANFISTESKNGFSALKGQVVNPYGKDLDVGGSSSGPGAAVATGLTQVAVGTETSGSILSPALQNSVIGLKPSVGYVSRQGIIPISPSQDVPGPMSRNVIDNAILFNAMLGIDPNDNSTKEDTPIHIEKIMNFSLKGVRLGYIKSSLIKEASKKEINLIDEQVELLKELDAIVVEVEQEKPSKEANFDILFNEFPSAFEEYLKQEPNAPIKSMNDLIEFNKQDPSGRIPYGQGMLDKCNELKLSRVEYEELKKFDIDYASKLDKLISEHDLDALIFTGYYGTWLPAKGGFPSVIVPAGYIKGRPFSITFTSTKFTEETLLSIAYKYEQHSLARKDPSILK